MGANQKSMALIILKAWKYRVLVEAHDKLRHQGVSCTYCLIKWQYYWKGMNKDILKYIANCTLCHRDKAKPQSYSLQMTEIPDRPFDKITIDLVTECKTSPSGNRHIFTIVDHLTGWLEAFPIPDKTADTIVLMFIKHYLPIHMCPRYIYWTKALSLRVSWWITFSSKLASIISSLHHITLRVMGNWKCFHKYLKPTLKKLCEKEPTYREKYINQVLTSYQVTLNLATAETPFFLVYRRDPNLPLHQLLEPMQCFLGDLESGRLNIETHWLALVIAKKILDENCFKNVQKTIDRKPPFFQIGDRVYFKNKQPGKWI